MIITESELREIWRDGRHPLPAFPPGTRFSPAAQDFLKDHQLEIHFAEPAPAANPADPLPITNYPLPLSLDSLAALTGLVSAEARRYQLPALARRLDALAVYCQQLQAASPPVPPIPANLLAAANYPLQITNYQLPLPPFAPGRTDHAILHWLNFLRARARQAAAQAAAAGNAQLAAALEQVSAAATQLGRQVQSGELGWNSPMV